MSNVPKLRFKEFSGEWEEKKLEQLSTKISDGIHSTPEYNEDGDYYFVNGNNLKNGVIILDENTKRITKEEYLKYYRELTNQTILMSINGTIGNLAFYNNENIILGKSACYININDIFTNKYFISNQITSNKIQYYYTSELTGSTIKNLSLKTIKNTPIHLPSKPEQEKIASFLTSVDTKIELLVRKEELLQQYKKGVMQKIFSQERRFKADDGSEYPDWEEKKVIDIFDVTRGYVLAVTKMSEFMSGAYKYPVYSSQTKNKGLTGYFTEYLYEDCITWTTDGANAGDVNFRQGKFYCTNVCGVLKSDEGYANECIAQILNSITKKYVSYVGNPKLMNNVMGNIVIKIPLSIQEQTKIASFLSSIDTKIEHIQKQLNATKAFKKALLQQMFV